MLAIDPTARIAPSAVIGANVEVGPYCVIGPNVAVGDNCRLIAHVHLTGHTTVGPNCTLYPFSSLGTPPQSVHYRGGPTQLVIGAKCQLRENVTINIGTEDGGGITRVGDNCFMMAGSHIAHDCQVGNNVVFANNAVIGGHCVVGDYVFLGGHAAVLQRVRVGESVMIAGYGGLREDVIPFGYVMHPFGRLTGLNLIGMRRRGIKREAIHAVRAAYVALFKGEDRFADRIERVRTELGTVPEVAQIIAFLRSAKRPIMMATPRGSHIDQFE